MKALHLNKLKNLNVLKFKVMGKYESMLLNISLYKNNHHRHTFEKLLLNTTV